MIIDIYILRPGKL